MGMLRTGEAEEEGEQHLALAPCLEDSRWSRCLLAENESDKRSGGEIDRSAQLAGS